jgi:hypothetical protein
MATEIVVLPGAKSKVWKLYGFRTDDKGRKIEKQKVICRVCDVPISFCGNTTNLLYHLCSQRKEYKTTCPTSAHRNGSSTSGSQTTLPSLIASSKPYARQSTRFQECEQSLLKLI